MSTFAFKQFSIQQEGVAMKVGTDGVLLGAWAALADETRSVLDVGTGTGLIALMLAQRFPQVMIDAIDIEAGAIEAAKKNFASSAWGNRIQLYLSSLQEFTSGRDGVYDALVCNPPYFSRGWAVADLNRKMARDAIHLPFQVLIASAQQLLNKDGSLQIILPVRESEQFLVECDGRLWCRRKTIVYAREGKLPKRVLLELVPFNSAVQVSSLHIESADGAQAYTDEYRKLTGMFYLNF